MAVKVSRFVVAIVVVVILTLERICRLTHLETVRHSSSGENSYLEPNFELEIQRSDVLMHLFLLLQYQI